MSCDRSEISLREIDVSQFEPGMAVLDVGCGEGNQVAAIAARGCRVTGIDPLPDAVARCCERGLNVVQGTGERLPFDDESFDAIVSRVVLPYTDERRVIAEMTRVLRPGGKVYLSCHGLGYHVYDFCKRRSFKKAIYHARSFVNAHVYRWTGRRLPGFWGDTLYQSPRAMHRYFRENGLIPCAAPPHDRFLSLPVFMYFVAEKPAETSTQPVTGVRTAAYEYA